jgi:hypothetical protein
LLNLPFHQWYRWLEKRFKELHDTHELEVQRKNEELKQWQMQMEQEKDQSKPDKKDDRNN